MVSFATIIIELHCYVEGFGTGEEAPVSVWILPRRLELIPEDDFESLKPESTRIVGPVALRIGNQVVAGVLQSMRQLGITVEEMCFPDD